MSELNLFLLNRTSGPASFFLSWFPSSLSSSFLGNHPTQPCLGWILGLATQIRLKVDLGRHCCWAWWDSQSLFSLVWGPRGGSPLSNSPGASSPLLHPPSYLGMLQGVQVLPSLYFSIHYFELTSMRSKLAPRSQLRVVGCFCFFLYFVLISVQRALFTLGHLGLTSELTKEIHFIKPSPYASSRCKVSKFFPFPSQPQEWYYRIMALQFKIQIVVHVEFELGPWRVKGILGGHESENLKIGGRWLVWGDYG